MSIGERLYAAWIGGSMLLICAGLVSLTVGERGISSTILSVLGLWLAVGLFGVACAMIWKIVIKGEAP